MKFRTLQQLMAVAIGVSYFWFGALKFLPQFSPAEGLVIETVDKLFFGLIPSTISIYLVATWEVLLGLLLFTGWQRKFAAVAVIVHIAFTFSPLILFFDLCFSSFPALSLLGQYIIKNLVFLVGALLLLKGD